MENAVHGVKGCVLGEGGGGLLPCLCIDLGGIPFANLADRRQIQGWKCARMEIATAHHLEACCFALPPGRESVAHFLHHNKALGTTAYY
eukprot:8984963-Ditylum_brightwellii.AAC.1